VVRLCRYELVVRTLGGYKNFVFDALSYFEPVERATNGGGMAGFRCSDNGTCERRLDLLVIGN